MNGLGKAVWRVCDAEEVEVASQVRRYDYVLLSKRELADETKVGPSTLKPWFKLVNKRFGLLKTITLKTERIEADTAIFNS